MYDRMKQNWKTCTNPYHKDVAGWGRCIIQWAWKLFHGFFFPHDLSRGGRACTTLVLNMTCVYTSSFSTPFSLSQSLKEKMQNIIIGHVYGSICGQFYFLKSCTICSLY